MSNPVLYSTGCPKCKVLAAKMDKAGIEYEVREDEDTILTLCQYLNTNSLPILEVGGAYLDFGKAVKWVGEKTNAD